MNFLDPGKNCKDPYRSKQEPLRILIKILDKVLMKIPPPLGRDFHLGGLATQTAGCASTLSYFICM